MDWRVYKRWKGSDHLRRDIQYPDIKRIQKDKRFLKCSIRNQIKRLGVPIHDGKLDILAIERMK